jgi:hypothetical protein
MMRDILCKKGLCVLALLCKMVINNEGCYRLTGYGHFLAALKINFEFSSFAKLLFLQERFEMQFLYIPSLLPSPGFSVRSEYEKILINLPKVMFALVIWSHFHCNFEYTC